MSERESFQPSDVLARAAASVAGDATRFHGKLDGYGSLPTKDAERARLGMLRRKLASLGTRTAPKESEISKITERICTFGLM